MRLVFKVKIKALENNGYSLLFIDIANHELI